MDPPWNAARTHLERGGRLRTPLAFRSPFAPAPECAGPAARPPDGGPRTARPLLGARSTRAGDRFVRDEVLGILGPASPCALRRPWRPSVSVRTAPPLAGDRTGVWLKDAPAGAAPERATAPAEV